MQTITSKIEFFQGCFGEDYRLARDGINITFRCPYCGKGTEKFKLSICLETFRSHCWVCGVKGKTPYYMIKECIGKEKALEFKSKFNIVIRNEIETIVVEEKLRFPSEFLMLAPLLDVNVRDPDIRDCIKYLKNRGVTKELMWRHKIGTFLGRRWNRRVVFPSFDITGTLSYYVSRTIDDDSFPKYLNCKADKTKIVFDEIRINWKSELIIVEGAFDLVKAGDNSVCILGSGLWEDHKLFQSIVKNQTPVILALDADMQKKTYEIANKLSSYGICVKMLDLGTYQDVGSMPVEIVRQKCKLAPIYSRESRLQHLIGTIGSGSMF